MKTPIHFIAGFPVLLLAVTAQAGSMTCGDVTISGDQDTGQSTDQILQQCGPPTSQDGNNWIYDRTDEGQGVYILHFNGQGQLDSVQQQVDQG
jgi:hypothetical protein